MQALLAALEAYRGDDAREEAMRARCVAFVRSHGPAALLRSTVDGHVTASAWIVDAERDAVVLLHHCKLGRWLQPGGHVDGDADTAASALREAREETGLRSLRAVTSVIYDVDVHAIPARGDEPAHEHFDVRYLFEADPAEAPAANDESHAVRWIALTALESYAIDDSVRRLALKSRPRA